MWLGQASEVWTDGTRFLKIAPAHTADGVLAEAERLGWLASRSPYPVPRVDACEVDGPGPDATGWLLTRAVPGTQASDPILRMGSVESLVVGLGEGLRRFHDDVPVTDCPFGARADALVESAERRVAGGGVDPSTMAAPYQRFTAHELLDQLRRGRPVEPEADQVVAHGDPTQPNLLVEPGTGELVGMVDLGRLGVSDRYRDLAIAVRSLTANLGPEVVWRFLDAYGIDRPDLARLEWYVLVDDLW